MPLCEKESFEQLFTDLYENRFVSRESAYYLWELVRYEVQDDRFLVWANPLMVTSERLDYLKEKAPIRLGCAFKIGDRCSLMANKRVSGYSISFWFDKELVKKISHLTDEDFDNGVPSQILSEFNERA